MKCPTCHIDKKPSQRLHEELMGLLLPCNDPQEANRYQWIIEKVGKVLDEMAEEFRKSK